MEVEEQEPGRLIGRHVVEVGRRVAYPFVNLADAQSGREVRVYLDATFSVEPDFHALRQHDEEVLAALDVLTGLTVLQVSSGAGGLRLAFEEHALVVEPRANDLTSHSPWWVGHVA